MMVMGDFNASVSDTLHGVLGPYGLGSRASNMVRDWCHLHVLMICV